MSLEQSLPRVRPGGWVLYVTCSLEPQENTQQVRWILERTGGRLCTERLLIPGGCGPAYHDGSYYGLVQVP